MNADASPERLPWIYTPWVAGLAFWLGVVGGPVVGTIVGASGYAVAFVDCDRAPSPDSGTRYCASSGWGERRRAAPVPAAWGGAARADSNTTGRRPSG